MKNLVSTAEKFDVYHHVKNQLYYLLLSWDITKISRTYFEYYKHASLLPSNMIVPTWSKIWCLFLRKSTSSLTFFFEDTAKAFANLLFWPQWHKLIASTCRNFLIYMQKISFSSLVFLEILQRCWNLLFWVFKHAWLGPSKTMVSALRKLWCLSSYEKALIFHLFFTKIFQTYYYNYFRHAWPTTPKQ